MKAIKSSEAVAVNRALMMLQPKEKRLYEDPYSQKLLSPFFYYYLKSLQNPRKLEATIKMIEQRTPGVLGWFYCRDKYVDDAITECLAKDEIRAIVNLGAGMDCRVLYLPGMENIQCFEVDHPQVIKKKTKKLKKILGELPKNVFYVPVDFQTQNLAEELQKAGYSPDKKTLFIWEAVTQYISQEANDSTFRYIGGTCPGSKVVFSYVIKSFFEGKFSSESIKKLAKRFVKKKNSPFITGFDPAEMKDYLTRFSLNLIEDVDSIEMQKRYADIVDLNVLKTIEQFDVERIILAEVK